MQSGRMVPSRANRGISRRKADPRMSYDSDLSPPGRGYRMPRLARSRAEPISGATARANRTAARSAETGRTQPVVESSRHDGADPLKRRQRSPGATREVALAGAALNTEAFLLVFYGLAPGRTERVVRGALGVEDPARLARFELATPGFVGRCSIQMSYSRS